MINKIYTEREYLYNPSVNIIFSLTIDKTIRVETLKTAIYYAVNHFEILRCRIVKDNNGEAYYMPQNTYCLPCIQVRDYHEEEQEFVCEQEKIPFLFEKGELIRFVIELLEDSTVLRVVSHHLAGDGKSILILIDEIMSNLKELDEGTFSWEDKSLIPLNGFTEEFLTKKISVSDSVKDFMGHFNENWKKEKEIFTYEQYIDVFNEYWENHNVKLADIKIGKETLKSVIHLCKENEVSINSLFIAIVLKKMKEQEKVGIVVDARTEEYNGMGNYAGSVTVDAIYDKSKTIWENTRQIHEQIHGQLGDRVQTMFPFVFKGLLDCNFQDAITFQTSGCYNSLSTKSYTDQLGYDKVNLAMTVSNLGCSNLREQYGQFKIKDLSFSSPLIPGLNCIAGLITVGGKMTITMQYNPDCKTDYGKLLEYVGKQFTELAYEDNFESAYLFA